MSDTCRYCNRKIQLDEAMVIFRSGINADILKNTEALKNAYYTYHSACYDKLKQSKTQEKNDE